MEVKVYLLLMAVAAAAAFTGDRHGIDWSTVVRREDLPGFWDNRGTLKAMLEAQQTGQERIVNGEETEPHAHPYQVALIMRYVFGTGMCGGILIAEQHVISAAHCPEGSITTTIILGAHNINIYEESQQSQIVHPDGYNFHPNYDSVMLYNDIVVLIMPRAVKYNQFIQPSVLPNKMMLLDQFTGKIATVSG